MDSDEQAFPYSRRPTNQSHTSNPNHPLHHQPPRDHILHPVPRQYTALPEFQDNYGNQPPPSMLQNTPRYPDSSLPIKEEHDLNPYLYSTAPTDFTGRGETNLIVHHPPQVNHNYDTIQYTTPHNTYPSGSNTIRMSSSRLETPDPRLAPGPGETSSVDFSYQMRALQPQQLLHPQRHQHGSLPHHQHRNHVLNHGPAFFSSYSSLDHEHSSPGVGGLDRQPESSLEYDSRDPHSVPGIVYEPMAMPGHSQQGVRRDPSLNHRDSLASVNSNNAGSGSYHTSNLPTSSIPMSNINRGTASSMNTSMPGAHTSSSFSMGPSSRWAGHPSGFDVMGSRAGTTSVHNQVPALSSTPASTSTSSSLRPILRHSKSEIRSSPERSFTQDNFYLRASTSAQTLCSSHSHTNSPSPRLSDNESNIRFGSELFSQDDRESDQDVETVGRMSEKRSAERKEVMRARGEEETSVARKKKSKMHCCEICFKKFPRPSGLKTHMNTHSNEKPFPCEFPGCTRSFGVRSNAKRHLRTHGVIPTPSVNPNSADAPYIIGFCPPLVGVPHLVEGGGDNIHTQDQSQSDASSAPILNLRWMPPSLMTCTNAESLREVRDRQQNWMGDSVAEEDEEDEDDSVGGSGISIRRTEGGGYDMEQDIIVDEGDEVENFPRLHPVIPSSSTSAVAESTGIRLTVSCPAESVGSSSCSEYSTQGTWPSSPSSSRIMASTSPVPSTSFSRSLSPPSMAAAYGQHEIDISSAGGSGVYTTRTENISREYGAREASTEERNSYLETGSHPYHPSQNPKYFG